MASIREVAQENIEEMKDGIAYIVLWKDGRHWKAETFYPDIEDGSINFAGMDDGGIEDYKELQKIVAEDPNACMFNSYTDNLNITDGEDDVRRGNAAGFTRALRRLYGLGHSRVADWLKDSKAPEVPADTSDTSSDTADAEPENIRLDKEYAEQLISQVENPDSAIAWYSAAEQLCVSAGLGVEWVNAPFGPAVYKVLAEAIRRVRKYVLKE